MAPRFYIEIDALHYSYRKSAEHWVLKETNLNIAPREYTLICGASGSGKSTLCRTFNGLIPHFYEGVFRGTVRVAGINTAKESVSALFSKVGMVFQNPDAQLFNQTVEREIAFGLESMGLPRNDIKRRIAKTAKMIPIEKLLPRHPHELSGGEQQLVSIAAILALQPQIIVLDEPYANLDPFNVDLIRDVLKKIHQTGTGIIVSEHRLPLTVADVQRIVVLFDGRIVLDGSPEKVLRRDIKTYGLELPPAASIGQHLNLPEICLDLKALRTNISLQSLPADLLPARLKPPAPDAPIVLEVNDISYEVDKKTVLRDICFMLKQGECLAVVGANGSGKTTLLKHLNGLCRPSKGLLKINGVDTRPLKVSQLAPYVGVAFQNPNSQFFKLTVWDEIVIGPETLDRYDESWIKKLVNLFRLEPLLKRAPYRLSEGEKKRVAFASALAARPAILALDEPTAGQDMFFREALGKLLAGLCSYGQSVLMVTQDLTFAERHTHRWLLMAEGEIVARGLPQEVMANKTVMSKTGLKPTEFFELNTMLGEVKKNA